MSNIIQFPTTLERFIKTYSLRESTDDELLDYGLSFSDVDYLINEGYLRYDEDKDKYIMIK